MVALSVFISVTMVTGVESLVDVVKMILRIYSEGSWVCLTSMLDWGLKV